MALRCTNAEPGTFNHECGKPAAWAGTHHSGHVQNFCDYCRDSGHEARSVVGWRRIERDELISALLDDHHADTPAGELPFLFNGVDGPRFLGYARSFGHADMILMERHLSAAKISTAALTGDERKFLVAH